MFCKAIEQAYGIVVLIAFREPPRLMQPARFPYMLVQMFENVSRKINDHYFATATVCSHGPVNRRRRERNCFSFEDVQNMKPMQLRN